MNWNASLSANDWGTKWNQVNVWKKATMAPKHSSIIPSLYLTMDTKSKGEPISHCVILADVMRSLERSCEEKTAHFPSDIWAAARSTSNQPTSKLDPVSEASAKKKKGLNWFFLDWSSFLVLRGKRDINSSITKGDKKQSNVYVPRALETPSVEKQGSGGHHSTILPAADASHYVFINTCGKMWWPCGAHHSPPVPSDVLANIRMRAHKHPILGVKATS